MRPAPGKAVCVVSSRPPSAFTDSGALSEHGSAFMSLSLLCPCASMAASVLISKAVCLLEGEGRLVLHNAELADSVVYMDHRIS